MDPYDEPIARRRGFGRRRVRPRAAVIDDKPHTRRFLTEALVELGFVIDEAPAPERLLPDTSEVTIDLVVIELPLRALDALEVLRDLSTCRFAGQVLLLGPDGSPMSQMLQIGTRLGLAMLPFVRTPFRMEELRERLAALLPAAPPPAAPVDVAEALRHGWLELWYQPKIDPRSLRLKGAEALVRMRHPTWGVVPPASFIPPEDDPQMRALSEFVVSRALADWHYFMQQHGPVDLAVNLPITVLQDTDFVHWLRSKLPLHPQFNGLLIEINETDVIQDPALAHAIATQLRLYNIGLSIDDLGSDFAQLATANDFPFVEVKVDQRFVSGCANDKLKLAACRTVVEVAHRLGTRTVAEGVETREDFMAVRDLGFGAVQGFVFARPMEPHAFARTMLARAAGFGRAAERGGAT